MLVVRAGSAEGHAQFRMGVRYMQGDGDAADGSGSALKPGAELKNAA